jgi:hypothetical protein
MAITNNPIDLLQTVAITMVKRRLRRILNFISLPISFNLPTLNLDMILETSRASFSNNIRYF